MCFGADKAAKAQEKAADKAAKVQWDMFNETKKLLAPFVTLGTGGIEQFRDAIPGLVQPFAPTIEQLEKTPGYQFALDQGLKSTQNAYAAKGLGVSGAAMKGAADYATGLAGTTFNQLAQLDLAQKAQAYNMLLGPVQIGANAAAGQASAGQQTGSNLANIFMAEGQGKAQAALQGGQALGNLIGGGLGLLGNIFTSGAGAKMFGL